jgi:ABC-type branched-subunit amino acid transport system permease subunit/ABC-type branched-subunit amino acid transport system ATPase component
MTFSPEVLTTGAITGLIYALLAAGLVLVYRSTGVINFAYGELGALCAAVLAKLVDIGWPFWLALLAAVGLGAVLGGAIELLIVRRLQSSPRLVLLVATIGVGQLLFLGQLVLPLKTKDLAYPTPIHREVNIGDLLFSGKYFLVLAVVPAVVVMLGLFLTRTPYGIAIRASAENPDAARLAGINPARVSTVVWVLSGALAALTVVMFNPVRGVIAGIPSQALGPGLLLRALAAALIGGLVSLPLALAGGILIGVSEALLLVNVDNKGAADAVLFLLILVVLLVRTRKGERGTFTGGFVPTPRPKPVPAALADHPLVRRLPQLALGVPLVVAVVLPFVFSGSDQVFLLSKVLIFAIAAISVTLLIGWAGQLTLGHFAFVGLGSMVTGALVARGVPFFAAVGYAVVAGMLAGFVVGAPALRLKGLFLAITTLAFAIASSSWLFPSETLRGPSSALTVPRADVFGLSLKPQRTYYFLCLLVLVAVGLVVSHVRRTGFGRSVIAVRDNEDRSSSLTVSPAFVKLATFALSAAIAALAGGLLAGLRVSFGSTAFGPELSLQMVSLVIIGGLGSVAGAVIGAAYVVGLPALFGDTPEVALMTSGVGLLLLLLYLPGGLVSLVFQGRDALLDLLARRAQAPVVEVPVQRARVSPVRPRPDHATSDAPALRASDVGIHLGGRPILTGVDLTVQHGETVGLIGANGAGKSTLLGVLSGFLTAGTGSIELYGQDVTGLAAHQRARLGMGRVFQDARLFGDLTVREAVMVALESRERSELLPSLLALPPSRRAERAKRAEADEVIAFLGLGRYADHAIVSLSTGSRRIVELACLLAQEARLLLLDEPTAGVAQREAEAFGPLVSSLRKELDATVVIIEHDIPLVSAMSDRLYCLALGEVIAEGTPDQVRTDPAVVAAYLGTDERAISRSGALTPKEIAVPVPASASNGKPARRSSTATKQGQRAAASASTTKATRTLIKGETP